jgi:glycosyltransferase involved in cell wall biosynthesis
MKVLLIGHACGPGLGSEPGGTWNWAWHLSHLHQVWLLSHPEHRQEVEDLLAANPNPNLRVLWVEPRTRFDPWKPEHGERGIRLHYILWLSEAYRQAELLNRQVRFDVAHHVSWGTVSAPPPFWKLPVRSVWGPIGGGQRAPARFRSLFGSRWCTEMLRSMHVRSMEFVPRLRRAVRSTQLVLATNHETRALLQRAGAPDVRPFLDCGLPVDFVPSAPVLKSEEGEFFLLWAGRLEPRKGLPLALEALARVPDLPIRLLVAGDGILRKEWEDLSRSLGLKNRVTFLGAVPYAHMSGLFQRCGAYVFTSLRDSFGSVVLEAMAHGLPILALNHQGVGAFVPEAAAIKVPVSTPSGAVRSLAEGIRKLYQSSRDRQSMALAAWACAKEQTWDRRAKAMSSLYEEVVSCASPCLIIESSATIQSEVVI